MNMERTDELSAHLSMSPRSYMKTEKMCSTKTNTLTKKRGLGESKLPCKIVLSN